MSVDLLSKMSDKISSKLSGETGSRQSAKQILRQHFRQNVKLNPQTPNPEKKHSVGGQPESRWQSENVRFSPSNWWPMELWSLSVARCCCEIIPSPTGRVAECFSVLLNTDGNGKLNIVLSAFDQKRTKKKKRKAKKRKSMIFFEVVEIRGKHN